MMLLTGTALAQEKFEIKNASKLYDVKLEVDKCEDEMCEGKAAVTLYKKNSKTPFQVFRLPATSFMLNDDGSAPVNETRLYDQQSAFNFGDFNFDGVDDIALCDGQNGQYGAPSYQVYLFSPRSGKFVRNAGLTVLGQDYLGMFEVDKKRKIISTTSKSGCCWHKFEEYRMVNNRPVKVFEEEEDAGFPDGVKTTTRRLVKGRWKKTVKINKQG